MRKDLHEEDKLAVSLDIWKLWGISNCIARKEKRNDEYIKFDID